MINEIFLAVVQATTEFLPISSSGHLALFSNIISEPNLFFITFLHFASLLAVLLFTRNEIKSILKLDKKAREMIIFIIIATIPAVLFGFFFEDLIEKTLTSYFFLSITFFFTGIVLLGTRFFPTNKKKANSKLNSKNSLVIGLLQTLALFPGVSRSGMTISAGLFSELKKEKAVKFSFILFIPLALGAMVLQVKEHLLNFVSIGEFFSFSTIIAFLLCGILSYLFLSLLYIITKKGYFWMFSVYCFFVSIISFVLGVLN